MDADRIASLAKKIHAAKKIIILGGDLATNLVGFLHYHLILLGLPSVTATSSGEAAHLTRSAGKGDMVIAISFAAACGLRWKVCGKRGLMSLLRGNSGYADFSNRPLCHNASSLRWKRLPLGLRILHPCACSMRFSLLAGITTADAA